MRHERDGRDVTMHNTRHAVRTRSTLICKVYNLSRPLRVLLPTPGLLCHNRTELTELPGKGTGFLQNFQKSRVLWLGRTELTEVPGGIKMWYPYPGYRARERAEFAEVSGTGIYVVQNFQKFRVRV